MTDSIHYLGLVDEETIALDTAALDLAALDHPEVNLAPYLDQLDAIAIELAESAGTARSNEERARALAQVIAGEFGFTGDTTSYDVPANADLIQVMDRRRGLPISLSILYVAAARRMDWAADALNTPGHVLVRIGTGEDAVLVDPFDDGALVGRTRVTALFAQATGRAIAPEPDRMAALSNRAALARLLLNQATRAEAGGDTARALALFERITIVAPASGHGWWERARLELGEGDTAAARASLNAMLEMTREPALRARITALLGNLADRAR